MSGITVNFDALDASGGTVSGAPLATYLASYGIALGAVSGGTTVVVAADQNLYGGQPVDPPSSPNVLTQFGSNDPVSFIVNFPAPLTSFSFTRPQLQPSVSGITHPAWQAYAFSGLSGAGSQVASASEGLIASYSTVPPGNYTLNGPGIQSVRFESQNMHFAAFGAVLLDDFVLNYDPLVVTTLTDEATPGDGLISLREAINYANANPGADTITFASNLTSGGPATLRLNGAELVVTSDLTITGPGANLLTINGDSDNNGTGNSRLFKIDDGDGLADQTVAISGLTLTKGNISGVGGAIYNRENVILTDNTLSGNSAYSGGGLYNGENATAMLAGSTLSGNTASSIGGAGGGIFNYHATATLSDSTLAGNSASSGGGIYNSYYATATLTNSTLTGNSAVNDGGGIYNEFYSTTTLTNSTLATNSANNAGGIYNDFGGIVRLTNSTLASNSANISGGGLLNTWTAILGNTIVAMNSAGSSAPDIVGGFGGVNSNGYNLIGNTSGSSGWVGTDLLGVNPLLAPLGNYGGVTQTMPLLAGSPAIDAGNTALALDSLGNPLTTDQRDAPFGRVSGASVDIGAVERQSVTIAPFPLVVSTLQDENDGDYSVGDLSLREAIGLANGSVGADAITFAPSLTSGGPATIRLNGTELAIRDSVTITGPGANLLTINGDSDNDGVGESRIFNIDDGDGLADQTVAISGLTLTQGSTSGNGGAIYNRELLTVADSTLSSNSAALGGAIFNYSPSVTLTSCTLTNCVLTNNVANDDGGGIYNIYATATLTNSSLSSNVATDSGGGIYNYSATVTLTNSTLTSNSANYGGGINSSNNAIATLTNSTLAGNIAAGFGGGLLNNSNSTATLTNSTLVNNTAFSGAGIYNDIVSTVTLRNSTLAGNSASNFGGGLFDNATANLGNTIITGNSAGAGGPDVNGSVSSSGYNLIGNTAGVSGLVASDLTGVAPLFVDAPNGNFRLSVGSPAIDAGTNTDAPSTDLDGHPRPIDGDSNGSAITDIGAYEADQVDLNILSVTSVGSGGWARGTADVRLHANSFTGTWTLSLYIDGVSRPFNGANQVAGGASGIDLVRTFDTTAYTDGTHSLVARLTSPSGQFDETAPFVFKIDNQAPTVTLLANQLNPVLEATGPNGATFVLSPTVVDNLDPNPLVTKIPDLVQYPLGQTNVAIQGTDAAGNVRQLVTRIQVRDTTPPTISLPLEEQDLTIQATSSSGTPFTFHPVASDLVDLSLVITSDAPAAGFSVGTTTVTFRATDDSGNFATVSTTITVNNNDAPSGADATITIPEDGSYTFATSDFGFTDPGDVPANSFYRVTIASVPMVGALSLSGATVHPGDFIDAMDLSNLTFTPVTNAFGDGYASFTFQVQDDGGTIASGVDLDLTPNTVTINVTAGAELTIAAFNANTAEGNSGTTSFTFEVTRTVNTAGSTTVAYQVEGTGVSLADNDDFGGSLPSGTVSFVDGESSKMLTILISGDTVFETNEGFRVTLSNPSGGADIITASADGAILDDDSQRTIGLNPNGGLTIHDNNGSRTDRLTVTYEPATNSLLISDPYNLITSGLGTQVSPTSVRVPLSALTMPMLTFDLGAGHDKLDLRTVPSSLEILINGGDGNDTIYANNSGDTINGGAGNDSVNGGTGNDVVKGESGNDTVFGGAGTDSIVGGIGADYLSGDAGNDTIIGGNDNDTLLGGDGNDTITGDSGFDSINGGNGNDTLDGGTEDDTIRGSSGNDAILGGTGNDQLFGENDNDTISGGIGNDSIMGGAGNDVLAGEAGADTVMGESGQDTIAGGSGSGKDAGDVVTDLPSDIRETLRLVFSNGAFIVTL